MTILHVSTPTSWRGGEQQVAYLAKALQEKKMDQVVLCPVGSALAKRMLEAGIPVATFETRGILNTQLARKITSLCKNSQFDIIHCHDSHAHTGAVISAAFFGNKTDIIVSRRVIFPIASGPLSRWKYNHPSVKKIICVSNAILEVASAAIKDNSKLCVVHSGIDTAKYTTTKDQRKLIAELNLAPGTKLVGCLGALDVHKDYPTFLRTAAAVLKVNPNVHFIIAGKGPEEKNLKQLIRKLNIEQHVHLLGFRDDVADVLHTLDIFLITTISEGLGTIILEAFAAGVPVVATRVGGIPEMVEDGITGLLADAGDTEAFKTATLRILLDPGFGKQLAQNALIKVEEFSFESTAEKTLHIYRSL